jgi:hypothetical protein
MFIVQATAYQLVASVTQKKKVCITIASADDGADEKIRNEKVRFAETQLFSRAGTIRPQCNLSAFYNTGNDDDDDDHNNDDDYHNNNSSHHDYNRNRNKYGVFRIDNSS